MINTEHDVIRFMKRFPDKIINNSNTRMMAKIWRCSTCKTDYKSDNGEMSIPAPCKVCDGICFEKVN